MITLKFKVLFLIIVLNSLSLKSQTIKSLGDVVDGTNPNVRGMNYRPYHSLNNLKVDTPKDSSLYFKIDMICAVVVTPDTSWINEQQRSMPEDVWNSIVDDQQYYQSMATDTLEAHGIKIIYQFGDHRYLKFVKKYGRKFTIDREKKKDLWGLILYNGIDDPVMWNDSVITKEMMDYYKIKNNLKSLVQKGTTKRRKWIIL